MSLLKSPEQRFFDQSYHRKTEQLSLFIQGSREQINFAFFDSDKRQIIGLEEWLIDSKNNWHQFSEELISLLSNEDYNNGFKSVSFALIDPLYTLVPSSLFKESELHSYLQLNHSLDNQSGLNFYSYELSSLNTHIIYAFPELLKKSLENRFKNLSILHYTAPLLEDFALKQGQDSELHLHILRDRFDVIYSKKGKLHFLNTFSYHTVEDFIYYLLYVMEQLEIDRNHVELKVFGEIEERSALYDTLFKYIRHPQLIARSNAINYSQPLSSIPDHKYRNIFNQYLCG